MNLSTNISQELLETVERYINQNMTSDELKTFEHKLESDSEFKVQVEDIKTLLFGIESQSLKEKLNSFHEDIHKDKTHNIRYLQFRKIAAAAVIILSIGSFWFFNQNSNDKLYANYFYPDPGLPTTMSSTNNYKFYEAMVNYKQGDYQTAISKWELLQHSKPNNDTLNYFIGVAHLADKNEQSAISFLEEVTKNSNFPLANDAYYYLGLAYLKTGNIDIARRNLLNSNSDKSKALLSELND
ncbi:tetratricopeptide repeat protein [Psychroserpens ponticola]|uniref:Tetratricopeptide repeat protein n=1 Tax=Psychroserpens ponticola TaxID=2932268 RepID=A0ABY7RVC2_9FLAO|nr:tetratricopeptide repeat protein [Psychroserpens ponticola]WCO01076.1 tetratricopeptide repeat protein [Psychroserpens ponticola]